METAKVSYDQVPEHGKGDSQGCMWPGSRARQWRQPTFHMTRFQGTIIETAKVSYDQVPWHGKLDKGCMWPGSRARQGRQPRFHMTRFQGTAMETAKVSYDQVPGYGKGDSPITTKSKYNDNKRSVVIFYKKWKKYMKFNEQKTKWTWTIEKWSTLPRLRIK